MKGATDWANVAQELFNSGLIPVAYYRDVWSRNTPDVPCIRCRRVECEGPAVCIVTFKPSEVPE